MLIMFSPLVRNNHLPLNYLKEISLSIWSSSHRDINSPGCSECSVICICGDGRIFIISTVFLYQIFPQTAAKPRIIQFKIHNLTYSDDHYISKGLQFMFFQLQWDRRYLCLPSKWQIFGKIVELCTARSGECPQILLYAFLH